MTTQNSQLPSFSLAGQVALVTAAGRGLGRAIAVALAGAGADVALGLRDVNSAKDLVAEIETLGRHALPLQMDVTKLDQITRAVDATAVRFGKLDILVNNAGNGFTNLAIDVPEEEFDATLNINLKATFFAAQAAAKIMMRQDGGRIINMSSQAGYAALPTESIYCASKAAVSHLTKCLAVEWGEFNITVNAVAPTFIRTPGHRGSARRSDVSRRRDRAHRGTASHRRTRRSRPAPWYFLLRRPLRSSPGTPSSSMEAGRLADAA